MTYTPTDWKTGDTITAEKLNNMEQGIANAGGLVAPTFTGTEGGELSCDMTFAEVNAAVKSGKCCYALYGPEVYHLSEYFEDDTVAFNNIVVAGGVYGSTIGYDATGITYTEMAYPEE